MIDFAEFLKWANAEGYDTAHTYDTDRSVWIFLNPMTADLRKAWQAARSHPAALAVHEVNQKCLPDGLRYMLAPLDLTGHQIMNLAAMAKAADSLDAVWFIKELPEARDTDGEKTPAGIGALTKGQPGWAMLSAAPSQPDAFASAGKPMPGVDGGTR